MDLRLAPVALGCWAASLTTLHLGWRVGLALLGVAAALAGVVVVRWRWVILGVAAGLACGVAATGAQLSTRDAPELTDLVTRRASAEVVLTVRDDPRLARGDLWVVPATLTRVEESLRLDARVLVLANHEAWQGFVPGQVVRASVRFGASRGGDLKAAVLSTSSPPVAMGEPPWIQRAAAKLRAGLQRACEPLAEPQRGLLPGLVVGDTSRLNPELEQQFRDAGLTHLTAVSGSNVAIVVGCVLLLARWARWRPGWTAALAVVAVAGFVILVRPSPSVLRAAAMGAIGLLALASGRKRAALPALCASVIVLLVIDPELAGAAGFALSVLATGGLLVLAPPLRDALRRRGVPGGFAEALAIPASAQLACSPVIAGMSGTVSLIAIPANLLAVPAVAPATVLGVVAAALSPVWPGGAEFAAWLGSWPAWWLAEVAQVASGVPSGVLPWPGGVAGALLLATITVVLLVGFKSRAARRVVAVLALAGVLGALPVRLLTPGWPPPGWIVALCDVGQGDALLLRAGTNAAVVVDTGPTPEGVAQCLREMEINSVPMVVLSHFHLDHIGGLPSVLGFRPGRILVPPWPEPAPGRAAVLQAAVSIGASVSESAAWTVGELTLQVLQTAPLHGTRSDPNNNSLVLLAETKGVRVLLLGDAETEQQKLIRAGYPGVRADVVKIAHHGSAFQDLGLLDQVTPRVALVSVGAGNEYGHPNPSLLARLTRAGVRVLRTDVEGSAAVVLSDGQLSVAVQ